MKRFRLKGYDIESRKIAAREVRLHFLSDLHGLSFGTDNSFLLEVIKRRDPDLILIGGDMIVGSDPKGWPAVERFIERLSREFPVYFSYGNHEQRRIGDWKLRERTPLEQELLSCLSENTVVLDNRSVSCQVKGDRFRIHGLSLEREYYKKPFPSRLTVGHVKDRLGFCCPEGYFHILLAHNPCHGKAYFQWGSDLTLSGHYHGGVVRFNENQGLVSTHFRPFPPYCCGQFSQGEKHMIVSAGLGEHTVCLRIHNPRELVEIRLHPKEYRMENKG